MSSPSLATWVWRNLTLSLVYALVAVLALRLILPPGYAAPLYPSAGLALAAMLCWGWRALPGVTLGAMVANVLLSMDRGHPSLLGPALIGLGAAAQAWLGACLVRRNAAKTEQDLTLTEPKDLASFYLLGAGLSCLISPSVGTAALCLNQAVPLQNLASTWGHWWVGDTLGVLIGAPIALTVLGRPRAAWAPRRITVGLPMLAATLLMALATVQVVGWEAQGQQQSFERDAQSVSVAMDAALQEPLQALAAQQALLSISPELSRRDFERSSMARLAAGSRLLALGWAERVTTADNAEQLQIRYIEPQQRHATALGADLASSPAIKLRLDAAVRSGLPTAVPGSQLAEDGSDRQSVMLLQPVYGGEPRQELQRRQAWRGMVFATLRPDQLLDSVSHAGAKYLATCLVQLDEAGTARRLAGTSGCEIQDLPALQRRQAMRVADQRWELRIWAAGTPPGAGGMSSLLFAVVGLISTALLGALLLTVTGRARRIEDLVAERTAALSHEVAERELSAQALRASEQRFRSIFEHAAVGVVFTDLRGVPQEVNPYFCRLVGYSSQELMERSSLSFTHPDDKAEDLRLGRSLLRGEIESYRRTKRYITRTGHTVQVRSLVSMLRDAKGEPYRLVGVVEDVTDQLKLRELEQARASAEAANQAKNEFLSRISHELRTPLNAMLGFTQLLELDGEHHFSQRQRAWLTQIQQAGWHLLEMINETLDWSRIETGALKLDLAPQALEPLLATTWSLVEADALQRGISYRMSLGSNAGQVMGDATRLKQVFTNLLSNAVKYNQPGGRIEVSSRVFDAGRIEVLVSDTGLGLTEVQQTQLFQPFNRLGREHSQTEGSGIGLVICKRLVEAMGGNLLVSSVAGQGSSFAVILPSPDEGEASAAD